MRGKYLSIDTEATGLEEHTHLLQIAFVPVDATARKMDPSLGKEYLVRCPSFEELRPSLNKWVLDHNEGIIRQAHEHGMPPADLGATLRSYLDQPAVRAIFGTERPILLGKSLSALDIPLLRRYLGWKEYDKFFHHHTVDVTSLARYLVDAGKLPEGCQSTTSLIRHFGIRNDALHTALSDALDMGNIYLKLLDLLGPAACTIS